MKKIYKKDVAFKRVSYTNNVRTESLIEVRVFGRRVGYLTLIAKGMGYMLEIDRDGAFENLHYRPEVSSFDEVREILRGQKVDVYMF